MREMGVWSTMKPPIDNPLYNACTCIHVFSLSLYLAILPLYSPHMSAICAYAIQREIRECKCTNEQKSCDREEKLNAKTVIIDYTVEQCYCIRYRPNRH